MPNTNGSVGVAVNPALSGSVGAVTAAFGRSIGTVTSVLSVQSPGVREAVAEFQHALSAIQEPASATRESHPAAALALLGTAEHRLNQLPETVTLDQLRVLDADGFVEALSYAWHSESPDGGGTQRRVPGPLDIRWTSPAHSPRMIWDWDCLWQQAIADPEIAAAIRVSERGKAELARNSLGWRPGGRASSQGEHVPPVVDGPVSSQVNWQERARRCVREAAAACQHAIDANQSLEHEPVKVVHKWLSEHPPSDDWSLPVLNTFRRYLSDARRFGWKPRSPASAATTSVLPAKHS